MYPREKESEKEGKEEIYEGDKVQRLNWESEKPICGRNTAAVCHPVVFLHRD